MNRLLLPRAAPACAVLAVACGHAAPSAGPSSASSVSAVAAADGAAAAAADAAHAETGLLPPDSEATPLDGPTAAKLPAAATWTQIPSLPFWKGAPEDYSPHPILLLSASKRQLLVALKPGWQPADLQRVAVLSGGEVAGALPGPAILQVAYPPGSEFADLDAHIAKLRADPAVLAVALDTLLRPNRVPPPRTVPAGPAEFPSWNWTTPSGGQWGLQKIHAPQAWNLLEPLARLKHAAATVAIVDSFVPHPDVELPGITAPWLPFDYSHGTKVAGIIAAEWGNQAYTDGVAPGAKIQPHATGMAGPKGSFEGVADSLSSIISALGDLDKGSVRPRVVNLSLGYNWSSTCVYGQRCDPRQVELIANSGCTKPLQKLYVTQQIDDAGKMAAAVIAQLNAAAPMLFVVSAGNDSGKISADPCDTGTNYGMGDFPLSLNSPWCWAAANSAQARPHIIVAEALGRIGKDLVRSDDSNAKDSTGALAATVFAPGESVGVCSVVAKAADVKLASGTSFAAPFVAGAAAWLVQLEPKLSNAELVDLLTTPPYARPFSAAGTLTSAYLDLFAASTGLDTVHPNPARPTIAAMLADCDDGTADGNQRAVYDDASKPVATFEGADVQGDGVVDLADFRRLRDTYLLAAGNLKLTVAEALLLPNSTRWDTNLDGVIAAGDKEVAPRCSLTDATLPTDAGLYAGMPMSQTEVFAKAYKTDPWQPVPAAALPLLFPNSADLIVRAGPALAAKKVTELELAVADPSGELPPEWSGYSAALTGLTVGADERILTVPTWPKGVRVAWRAAGDAWVYQNLPPLSPGEDRVVVLKLCGPPTAVITAQSKVSQITTCQQMDYPTCAQCSSCTPAKPLTISLSAAASTNAPGQTDPLTYTWAFKPIGGSFVPESTLPMNKPATSGTFNFGPVPCGGSKNVLNVTLTVYNGCATATATKAIDVGVLVNYTCF